MIILKTDGTIQQINDAAIKIFNIHKNKNELININISDLYIQFKGNKFPFESINNKMQINNIEFNFITLTGKHKSILLNASSSEPLSSASRDITLTFIDVTEYRQLMQEMFHQEKFILLNKITESIANDFNNFLTAILNNIALVKMKLKASQENYNILAEAEEAAEKAKNLTQQLLFFSEDVVIRTKPVKIESLCREEVSNTLKGTNIKFNFFTDNQLWPLEIDENLIRQVIRNLIYNALEAMPNGGSINITLENSSVTRAGTFPPTGENLVNIKIEDTGTGIAKELISKIFDPYFTTKEKSSGIGLTAVYSIIKKHHGYISVESEINKGTTFIISLPTLIKNKETRSAAVKTKKLSSKHQKKLLIMDDSINIMNTIKRITKLLGYKIDIARNGEEAIRLYKHNLKKGHHYQAVILDLVVPGGKGGRETLDDLLKINPHVKAIISTGYASDPIIQDYQVYGFKGVLIKPYDFKQFKKAIEQVINI